MYNNTYIFIYFEKRKCIVIELYQPDGFFKDSCTILINLTSLFNFCGFVSFIIFLNINMFLLCCLISGNNRLRMFQNYYMLKCNETHRQYHSSYKRYISFCFEQFLKSALFLWV